METDTLCKCRVLFDFEGDYDAHKTLSVKKGDVVLAEKEKVVVDESEDGKPRQQQWCVARKKNRTGFLPAAYLEVFETESDVDSEISVDLDEMVDAVALFSFEAKEKGQLSFQKGQVLLVEEDEADWWPGAIVGEDGIPEASGFVPSNYVQITPKGSDNEDVLEDENEDENETISGDEYVDGKCKYDFVGKTSEELSFKKGTIIHICPTQGEDWWPAYDENGNEGYVPKNYLEILEAKSNPPSKVIKPEIINHDYKHSNRTFDCENFRSTLKILSHITIFKHIPMEKLSSFAPLFKTEKFGLGELIFRKADKSDRFYVICDGQVEVNLGKDKKIQKLKRNDFFGEIGLVESMVRTATVSAVNDPTQKECLCISLAKREFELFITICPEIKMILREAIRVRLERKTRPAKSWIKNNLESMVIAASKESLNKGLTVFGKQDSESANALDVWNSIGELMKPCQKVLEELPQYLHPPLKKALTPSNKHTFLINVVCIDQAVSSSLTKATIKVTPENTVGDVIRMLFDKIGSSCTDNFNAYGLKLASRNSYFLHHDMQLNSYKHVSHVLMKDLKYMRMVLVNIRKETEKVNSCRLKDVTTKNESSFSSLSPTLSPDVWAETVISCSRLAEDIYDTHEKLNKSRLVSSSRIDWPFRMKLVEIVNLADLAKSKQYDKVCMRISLVYGGRCLESKHHWFSFPRSLLSAPQTQKNRKYMPGYRFDGEWIYFNRLVKSIHLSTRICITIFGVVAGTNSSDSVREVPEKKLPKAISEVESNVDYSGMDILGGVSFQIFDSKHVMNTGLKAFLIWENQEAEKCFYCTSKEKLDKSTLLVELDEYLTDIYYSLPDPVLVRYKTYEKKQLGRSETEPSYTPTPATKQLGCRYTSAKLLNNKNRCNSIRGSEILGGREKRIKRRYSACLPNGLSETTRRVLLLDPINAYNTSLEERNILWKDRESVIGIERALPRLMFSVDWSDRKQQREALELLERFEPPKPLQAMELLDRHFGDYRLREYAVRCLEPLEDDELSEFMLQLVQVLKYEPYHESALARFLLRRALQNHREVGQKFFWCLLAEMHDCRFSSRFSVLLKAYYDNCGVFKEELTKQHDIQVLLKTVADSVVSKKFQDKKERLQFCRSELRKVNMLLPETFSICLDPIISAARINPEKCKVMNSKKKPLWLHFNNLDTSEGEPILVMFKSGDDLRQDQMTLQLLRFMDKLWLESGLNLKLTPYQCVSSGDEVGMIEVVTNSDTTANIQKKYGGKLGALSKNSLKMWLEANNDSVFKYAKAVENFVHSCAGYCVATYVLGIGDRHSDNIMLSKDGHLFHIDFGHFLGHFKKKFGMKRERTAFVFTKEMAFVMGGKGNENYNNFVSLCCRAYNCIRAHGDEFINLFRLMIPAGMPELKADKDIEYLSQKLCLSHTDDDAAEIFKREINTCLADTYRRIDNLIHNWKVS